MVRLVLPLRQPTQLQCQIARGLSPQEVSDGSTETSWRDPAGKGLPDPGPARGGAGNHRVHARCRADARPDSPGPRIRDTEADRRSTCRAEGSSVARPAGTSATRRSGKRAGPGSTPIIAKSAPEGPGAEFRGLCLARLAGPGGTCNDMVMHITFRCFKWDELPLSTIPNHRSWGGL